MSTDEPIFLYSLHHGNHEFCGWHVRSFHFLIRPELIRPLVPSGLDLDIRGIMPGRCCFASDGRRSATLHSSGFRASNSKPPNLCEEVRQERCVVFQPEKIRRLIRAQAQRRPWSCRGSRLRALDASGYFKLE
jgi:hypothetical protein